MFTESVRVGYIFTACRSGSAKKSNMFDISPTLHDSVSGLWLHSPRNHPVKDFCGLSVTLPVLSFNVTVLS